MGCQNAKEGDPGGDTSKRPDQNGTANAPPAVDPRQPLNARQLFLLKKSWKGVKRNMEATGVELFVGLFRKNADLKQLFTHFRSLDPSEDLRSNQAVEAHGTLVMEVFDECICHFEDVDYVENTLKNHMEQPFLDALKIILDDRYTDQMDVIYQLTVKFLLASLTKACKDSQETPS